MKKALLPLVAVAFGMAACGDSPVGPAEQDSFMEVRMEGHIEQTFQGAGTFHLGTRPGGQQQFQIVSRGEGQFNNQGIAITRWAGGQLSTGTYAFELARVAEFRAGAAEQAPDAVTLQFGRRIADPSFPSGHADEFYVAYDGSLNITQSTEQRVAGTFTADVFRYCARDADMSVPTHQVGPCELPAQVIQGAPTLTVEGSFSATPLDNTFDILW